MPRSEIEEVLAEGNAPIELVLDVTRAGDAAAETRSVAVSWERSELKSSFAPRTAATSS